MLPLLILNLVLSGLSLDVNMLKPDSRFFEVSRFRVLYASVIAPPLINSAIRSEFKESHEKAALPVIRNSEICSTPLVRHPRNIAYRRVTSAHVDPLYKGLILANEGEFQIDVFGSSCAMIKNFVGNSQTFFSEYGWGDWKGYPTMGVNVGFVTNKVVADHAYGRLVADLKSVLHSSFIGRFKFHFSVFLGSIRRYILKFHREANAVLKRLKWRTDRGFYGGVRKEFNIPFHMSFSSWVDQFNNFGNRYFLNKGHGIYMNNTASFSQIGELTASNLNNHWPLHWSEAVVLNFERKNYQRFIRNQPIDSDGHRLNGHVWLQFKIAGAPDYCIGFSCRTKSFVKEVQTNKTTDYRCYKKEELKSSDPQKLSSDLPHTLLGVKVSLILYVGVHGIFVFIFGFLVYRGAYILLESQSPDGVLYIALGVFSLFLGVLWNTAAYSIIAT